MARTPVGVSRPAAARRLLRSAFFVGLTAYLAFALMLTLLQSRLVYFPMRSLEATPAEIGLRFDDVWLRTEDGVRLHGWWVPAEQRRGAVLFLHGNAGNISHRLHSIETFHRLGFDTFIFDYRGYGRSEGRPSEAGTYRDAAAAWRYLVEELDVPPSEVVLFGRSLGGAVAAWLAEHERPAALILESTFTSIPDLGAELYPFLPVRWLARIRYDTRARLPQIAAPVLVVHSPDDEIIPFHHALRLWEAAAGPKTLLEITGTHNDGFIASGDRYVAGLREFLREVVGRGS